MIPTMIMREIASVIDTVKITLGKHKGRIVKVTKIGQQKATFKDGIYKRYVNHIDYVIVEDIDNDSAAPHTPPGRETHATVCSVVYESPHFISVADWVAARAHDENDIDRILHHVTDRIKKQDCFRTIRFKIE